MRNLNLKILVALVALVWAGNGASQSQELVDIKEFVQGDYIHGVPYEEASRYDASVVPTLLRMLKDPKEQEQWSNIVVTLGMIGDESAVEPMIEFIERDEGGTLNRSQRSAKTAAIMALGYLVNKSGSPKALDYLTTILDPQKRAKEDPATTDLFAAATAERGKDLSKYAVMGLALSGHPKAAEALKSFESSLKSIEKPLKSIEHSLRTSNLVSSSNLVSPIGEVITSHSKISATVSEALRANKEIADKGLAEYYGGM